MAFVALGFGFPLSALVKQERPNHHLRPKPFAILTIYCSLSRFPRFPGSLSLCFMQIRSLSIVPNDRQQNR